jgi:hypothetical protein
MFRLTSSHRQILSKLLQSPKRAKKKLQGAASLAAYFYGQAPPGRQEGEGGRAVGSAHTHTVHLPFRGLPGFSLSLRVYMSVPGTPLPPPRSLVSVQLSEPHRWQRYLISKERRVCVTGVPPRCLFVSCVSLYRRERGVKCSVAAPSSSCSWLLSKPEYPVDVNSPRN